MKKLLLLSSLLLLLTVTSYSQGCLPQGITFSTQNQVDSFQVNYPGCTEILGNVIIGDPDGTDIDSLGGLSVITSIGGSLVIGGNHSLLNLTGLENLDSVGQNLYLYILESTPYSLYHVGNYSLESLAGMDNLNYIGGNLGIINNSMLCSCESQWICEYLANPNGTIDIYGNSPGCNSVVELAGFCGDSLQCLPLGNYFLSTQDDIDNFPMAFPGCTELEGDVTIFGLDNITDLDGLNTLTSIGGDLGIWDCQSLPKLSAFENLTTIGEDLMIEYNGFESLTGLHNLTMIGGGIIILGNEQITSLSGIDNIDGSSITSLLIWDNINLSVCDVASICDYLASPNNPNYIQNNSPGCNHRYEILDACEVSIDESAVGSWQLAVEIYPNPSSSEINIEIPGISGNTELVIFNLSGQEMARQQISNPLTVIDISYLTGGIYFVKVSDEQTFQVGKFVKR